MSAGEPETPTPQPLISEIKDVVAKHFKVTVLDLESQRRGQDYVVPRHIAFLAARQRTRHSLPRIGKAFGDRDHTTVLQGIVSVQKKMRKYPEIRRQFAAVERKLDQLAAANSRETVDG